VLTLLQGEKGEERGRAKNIFKITAFYRKFTERPTGTVASVPGASTLKASKDTIQNLSV
jgi:hypothetical protein